MVRSFEKQIPMSSLWSTSRKGNLRIHRRTWKIQLVFVVVCCIFYYCYRCSSSTSNSSSDKIVSTTLLNDTHEGLLSESKTVASQRYEICSTTSNGTEDTICPIDNVCCGNLCLSGGTADDHPTNGNRNDNRTNTNATCCNTDIHHSSTNDNDDDVRHTMDRPFRFTSTTGCGVNYMCSTTNRTMCTAIPPIEHDPTLPRHVPRTKLCHFTYAMTHIYAIPMMKQEEYEMSHDPVNPLVGKEEPIPVATYLSSMGPIHEDEDEDETFANITRVIVLIHGSRRNVEDYLCCVNAAMPTSSSSNGGGSLYVDPNEILILAPWFPTEEDGIINITTTKSQNSNTDNHKSINQSNILRWIGNNNDPFEINHIFHTWRYGAGAINAPNISSYNVVDRILTQYLYNRTKFPTLRDIMVTGHSAGGQYVQRWALLSNSIHDENTAGTIYDSDVHAAASVSSSSASSNPSRLQYPVVHTVVANPKSYAYLDERRWMNTTRHDTMTNQSTFGMEFRIPTDQEISHCWTYNDWEWGFDHRSNGAELVAPYVSKAIATAGGINVIIERYADRNVIYLSGEEDVLFNGDCNDRIQGPNRRVRSERYYDALQQYFPSNTPTPATTTSHQNIGSTSLRRSPHRHQRFIVPNVPHNHCLMYQSVQGQTALFGILPNHERT